MLQLHQGNFVDTKWVKIPSLAALQVVKHLETVKLEQKNKSYLGKNLFFNFLGANFLAPKSVHDVSLY